MKLFETYATPKLIASQRPHQWDRPNKSEHHLPAQHAFALFANNQTTMNIELVKYQSTFIAGILQNYSLSYQAYFDPERCTCQNMSDYGPIDLDVL